jgi:glycosyltransferase involved in cell wall biosynthesis
VNVENSKFNLVFVTSKPAAGGAEKSLVRIAEVFAEKGNQVHLLFLSPGGPLSLGHSARIIFLSDTEVVRFSFFKKLMLAYKLRRYVTKIKGAVVVSTLPVADEVVALSGCSPAIFRIANLYGVDVDAQTNLVKRAKRLNRYKYLYGNRKLVCTTRFMAEHMRDAFGSNDVTIIHNFVNNSLEMSVPDTYLKADYCIHIGRFVPQKRHIFLFEVWAMFPTLPDLVLLTQPNEFLERAIERLNLWGRVKVMGYVQNPMPLISGSKCLVLCSKYEGFPSVIIEAMQAQVRIATGSCGGVADEICSDTPEVICDDSSVDVFGNALVRILDRPPPDYALALSRFSETRAIDLWSDLIRSTK